MASHLPSSPRATARPWPAALLAAGLLLGATTALLSARQAGVLGPPPPLLLAPMLSGLDHCLQNSPPTQPEQALPASCLGPEGSAGALVQASLERLGPAQAPGLVLGYSLKAPLLDFLRRDGADWRVDTDAVRRLIHTVRDVPRPVVLYLFATHFETHAPIEAELAQDPANLAHTPDGPLPIDHYYADRLYPWSVARTDNTLTRRREQVIDAITAEACRQPQAVRERLAAITVLGETHQLFPGFENGMGFAPPYRVSDYSEASRQGFRQYLAQRLGGLEPLNALLQTRYQRWDEVPAPDQDALARPGVAPERHLDAYAQGRFPVSGWVAPEGRLGRGVVRVYLDGLLQGRAPIGLNRQDVLAALPALGSADVGWRHDIDFRALAAGPHRIDLFLERSGQPLRHLGTRHIELGGRYSTAGPARLAPGLPTAAPADPALRQYIDAPAEGARYAYNPLALLWHAYRNQQVLHYLQHFQQRLARSCLGQRPLYTHQLVPYANPSWDAAKYAVDASLQPQSGLRLGVSLYGETTYGRSMIDWLHGQGQRHYGVTEFHPLKALSPEALAATLEQHRNAGAGFVSMFVEGRWQGHFMSEQRNPFAFDPGNTAFGSDRLYASLQALLRSDGPRLDPPALPAALPPLSLQTTPKTQP